MRRGLCLFLVCARTIREVGYQQGGRLNNPRLSTAIWLGLLMCVAVTLALLAYVNRPGDVVLIGALSLVALVFGIAAIATGLNWLVAEAWDRWAELNKVKAITPMLELVQSVSRLNKDQIGLISLTDYRAVLELVGSNGGPIFTLRTAGGSIPFEFVEKILVMSSPTGLISIRSYSDGSPEREWLKLFTQWCIDMHLAIPAEGPHAARWIERGGRYKAAHMLGIELHNEKFEAQDE